jgi:hypothetical protein
VNDPLSVPLTAEFVRGAVELETTATGVVPHRLPGWARRQFPDPQLLASEAQPSGVRLVLRTAATRLELTTRPTRHRYRGLPSRPPGVYDLRVDGELFARASAEGGSVVTTDPATGAVERTSGPPAVVSFAGLPAGDKLVEVWLPHHEATGLVSCRADAPVRAAARDRPVWVHHGSSLSQGSNAASPSTTWPALAAAAAGLELVNLGFGGGAMLDASTARVVRDLDADVIGLELGINVVNADAMRLRAFTPAVHGFLDTVREGHPATPVVVVSPLHCAIHEETPGPGAFDRDALAAGAVRFVATGDPADVAAGRLTLSVVRAELARIVAQRAAQDPNLHLVDGLSLFGAADEREHPLPDGLHLDAASHAVVGRRFARHLPGV